MISPLAMWPLLLLVLAGRPTDAALRKAFERNRESVVTVTGQGRKGAGVVVGADGHIVTSVSYVGLTEAKVTVGDRELSAKVVSADARLQVAVLQLADAGAMRAAPVRLNRPPAKGEWLVGIRLTSKGALSPLAGRVTVAPGGQAPFFETDLPLPPGSPLFDASGKLVAISVQRRGSGSKALPIGAVKAHLQAQTALEASP